MSALDDLQSAGFSEREIGQYASEQRQALTSAGFSDDEINQHLGAPRQPDTAGANKAFSRVLGDALTKAAQTLKPAGETMADVGSVYAPVEAALNAGTGLLFGFPAYVGAALGGLVSKHLLGSDADPKELAETMSKVFTYQPMTARGQRLAGNVMMPLTMLQEGSEAVGHGVTDVAMKAGASDNVAAALGAVTDSTIQMLAPSLLGELARKMGGQTVTNEDMRNTAKVIAGPEATHEVVAAVEQGLQSTYQKTGIGPYTVLDDAHKNPEVAADLANPKLEIPKAYEQHVEKPAAPDVPTPGDGAPLLDVSGPTAHEAANGIEFEPPGRASEHMVGGLETREVPLKDISLSEDLPQFKSGANEKGVVEPLGGKFDRTGVAPIQLWQRTNGDLEVISGRHRLDLAQRSGEATIPSQVHYEDQGFDARKASALDAELNIRDGQGKVRDYVDYFRSTQIDQATADQRGLLARAVGKRAFSIASNGSDELVAAHRSGVISDEAAVAISDAAPGDARLQAVGIRAVQDGKTIGQAANTVRAVKLLQGDAPAANGDLFGFDDSAMREAEQMAKIATSAQRELSSRISAISGAAKRPELAAAEGINVKDSAAVLRRVEELKAERAAWDNWSTNPDLIEEIRSELHPDGEPLRTTQEGNPKGDAYQSEQATLELNAGLNPAASLRAIRDSYTPFVGVASPDVKPPPVKPVAGGAPPPNHPILDSLQKIFAPASRGEIAQAQANIMRANFGEMAREREVALTKMEGFAAQFDKMPVAESVKFIDAYEHGTKLADPQLSAAAEALHALNQSRREAIQNLGKGQLENFDENYLGRIWKDDTGRAERDMIMRRPLEGSKNMLKARTIPYYTDGLRWRAYDAEGDFIKSFDNESAAKIAAGTDGRVGAPLTPITTNPVEMALLKVREADKYIYGQRIFAEMKDAELARFVRFGETPLPGWAKINDKIARVFQPNEGEGGGMILRGEYYAPDQAATLINNHLSPGFQGNGFFDAWRGIGNAVNGLQLGLSAFHVGFTSMDAMISKAALGVMQISRGDVLKGAGNVAQGLNPAQPFLNIYKGDKLLRAYLGDLTNPDLAPIVDAIQQAGGRVKMDDFYRNAQVNAFKQALRAEDYKGAAKAFLPTVLDRISAPIFEWLVPRQKLGVFFDMAKDWIEQNPKADVSEKRAGLGKLWDSVDNRMGQLVYDNVFWDRALKDGLMATVRSVGWNLGTFRELGGGVLDIKDIGRDKGFSSRTAYVVALPLMASIYGSLLNYAFTGEAPQSLKDTFYPRTGKLRPDGSEDRVSLPTYMKDVFAYGEDAHNFAAYGGDPTQTIKNKMHPLISTVSQMLNNKDFFGGAIRNPADKAVEQIADEIAFLIQQFSPFSYRNYIQQAKVKGEEPTVMGYLTSPSMIGVTPAPGYMVKSEEELESGHVSQMHDSLMTKFKQEIKGGKDPETLIPEMIRSGMTKRDIKYIISSSGEIPKPHKLKKFGSDDE